MGDKFELLYLYKLINGNTTIPTRYVTKDGAKLGSYVNMQRTSQDQTSKTRISKLDSISFN